MRRPVPDPAIRRSLARLPLLHGVPEGQVLFRRGDPGEGLLILLDGLLRLHVSTGAGRELTLGLAGSRCAGSGRSR
jgi:CRP-like cAMP-binding protein